MSKRTLPNAAAKLPRLRIAVYVRLSDADDGVKEGTAEYSEAIGRQTTDALAVARTRHGLPADAVVRLHTDPDADKADVVVFIEDGESAWKLRTVWITDHYGERRKTRRVMRLVWAAMMRALRARRFDVAIIYNSDRLVRDPYDCEDVIETARDFGRRWDASSGSIDLRTDDGHAMLRVMTAMANKASADTSRRARRKYQDMAQRGEMPGGASRPFGWCDDRRSLHPVESAELRRAVERIRAGIEPAKVLADWKARGILTPRGNAWRWTPFLGMLRSPRLCGYRAVNVNATRDNGSTYRYWEIVTGPDGTEVRGQWEPIITRAEWDDLIERIGVHMKPRSDYTGARTKHLLSGIIRCGKCGTKMVGEVATTPRTKSGTVAFYFCPKPNGGCGGVSRSMRHVDELIEAYALALHAKASTGDPVAEDDGPARAEVARIDGLLADAYAEWKRGDLKSARYFAMTKDLEAERDGWAAQLAASAAREPMTEIDAIAKRWPDATVDERRAFVLAYLTAVVAHPIEPTWDEHKGRMVLSKRFNPALIEPVERVRAGGS